MENYIENQTISNKLIKTFFIVLLIIIGFVVYFKSSRPAQTITVVGVAETAAKPDKVTFVVTRINSSTDVALGIDDGTNGINKLIQTVKGFAGNDVEIKKTFYQITPQSNTYTIANAFSVSTTKTGEINNWIKKLYAAGATTVSNVVFESNDFNSVDQELKTSAIKDAQLKANSMAKSMSKKIGRLVSVLDETSVNSSTIESIGTDDGFVNLSKNLSVTYEIK